MCLPKFVLSAGVINLLLLGCDFFMLDEPISEKLSHIEGVGSDSFKTNLIVYFLYKSSLMRKIVHLITMT